MAHTKGQFRKAARLGAQLGPELLDLAKEIRDREAAHIAQKKEQQARELADAQIASALEAEAQAFEDAGLIGWDASDDQGHRPIQYYRQSVTLVNTKAHPRAIVATALSRAERLQAFARVFEQSQPVQDDRDARDGAFTLARMTEEVVELLSVLSRIDVILKAQLSTVHAA